jgi:hypothetical protein
MPAAGRLTLAATAVRMVDGFMVTPRLCGRRPSQRLRPALLIEVFMWSGFDTAPTEAKHWP